MKDGCRVNEGKKEFVESRGEWFGCYAVKTTVVTQEDKLDAIIEKFAVPIVRPGDIVFVSEKMVACTQGRAYPVQAIRAGFFARLLSRFVTQTPCGIGLSIPETMQCAIDEIGLPRTLAAAFAGGIGKILHKRGWFYVIAGRRAASIDGPCGCTLPPYNEYVVLGPQNPDLAAKKISRQLGGNLVLVVDANDLGCEILGTSERIPDKDKYLELLMQNPLGQNSQCTPIGILRPVACRAAQSAGSYLVHGMPRLSQTV